MTEELKPANRSEAIGDLAKALATAQGAFPPIPKSKVNPRLGNAYATLDDIISTTRKALSENALAVMQTIEGLNVVTLLVHGSGQWQSTTTPIMVGNITSREGREVLTSSQAFGSGLTYARKYGLAALLNVAADDDDDGNSAGEKGKAPVTRKVEATPPQDAAIAPKAPVVVKAAPPTEKAPATKGQSTADLEKALLDARHDNRVPVTVKAAPASSPKDGVVTIAAPILMTPAQAGRLKAAVGDMNPGDIKKLLDRCHVDRAAQLTEAEAEKLIAELTLRGQEPEELFVEGSNED